MSDLDDLGPSDTAPTAPEGNQGLEIANIQQTGNENAQQREQVRLMSTAQEWAVVVAAAGMIALQIWQNLHPRDKRTHNGAATSVQKQHTDTTAHH